MEAMPALTQLEAAFPEIINVKILGADPDVDWGSPAPGAYKVEISAPSDTLKKIFKKVRELHGYDSIREE